MGEKEAVISMTSDIVTAFVSNNSVAISDVPVVIRSVFEALSGLASEQKVEAKPMPAVPIRSSVKPDYLICLEDGRKMKMLRRHLMTAFNMTPDEYRTKWGLPNDYPMVAPNYAEKRRVLAKKIGLGLGNKGRTNTRK